MKILLVEDDVFLASNLMKQLKASGFDCQHAADGEEGLDLSLCQSLDAVILDVNLPKKNGFSILGEIRKTSKVPVLMLTNQGEVEFRVKGLQSGADDYLLKPFHFEELLARLNAIIRRFRNFAVSVLKIQELEIHLESREVFHFHKKIELSRREFDLLCVLAFHRNQVLNRAQIQDQIYDLQKDQESNIIDVYITYLRRKIDKPFKTSMIQTIRGIGYCIKD